MPSFWNTDLGIKLMLAPGSHSALVGGFDILLRLDDKGDVSARDNGSGLGRLSRLGIRSRQSFLQSYWLMSKSK
ncbi:hypothetical protein V6N11_021930 [Hibiscus sabdariffa]|uniref:Uncharacterized protein n=1 Tax=Hibiscus sabdariffa TaxID=183260 RepID=A0ABR2TI21_9ROSI